MTGSRRAALEAPQPVEQIPGLDALADAFLSLRTTDEARRFVARLMKGASPAEIQEDLTRYAEDARTRSRAASARSET